MADNYRALTRTYRPTSFDDIVSQEHVSSTLKNAIKKNRLAHAYMFCGPRGVGKTTMARVLARTVNQIDQQVDGEALNQTLNIIEIDAASNNKVDDIRDLRERVRIPPQNGRYKIYIVDEVHMLTKSAFNALLKTLEEPPDHVIFIFATTEPHKVLPTILSRVQRFDFKRISIEEIVEHLDRVARQEGISIDEESLHVIAKKADGALRDALGLMDQAIAFCGTDIEHEELLRALNVVSTERMFEFMDAVQKHDASQGLELINELLQEGYDIQEYLVGLTEHLRNLYVATTSERMHLVEASPQLKKRYKQSSGNFSEDDLMRMLHIVSEAQFKIKDAHQPKIQFEITLLKLINMERTRELNTLIQEIRDLKKNFSNGDIAAGSSIDSTPSDEAPPAEEESGAAGSPAGGAKPSDDGQRIADSAANNNPAANGRSANKNPKAADHTASHSSPETNHTANSSSTAADHAENSSNGSVQEEDASYEPAGSEGQPEHPVESNGSESRKNGQDGQEGPVQSSVKQANEQAPDNQDDPVTSLFGESSLAPSPAAKAQQKKTKPAKQKKVSKKPQRAPKDVEFREVEELWEDYTLKLRKKVPEMLYFQMQRVDPIKLDKGDLLLRCNDDFAKKIVDENKRQLAKLLQDELGAFLNFKSVVQKDKEDTEETMSPYERFKQLQERDPAIKTLIELFGAELDYNLGQ